MSIPVVDFGAYSLDRKDVLLDEPTHSLSQELRKAFVDVGFVFLTNTGVTQEEVDRAMEVSKKFFLQPDELKRPFRRGNFANSPNHGWVSLETESLNPRRPGDLKEAFNSSSLHPDIKWPSGAALGFQEIQTSFFLRCKELSLRVLRVMAHSLGLDPEVFLSAHRFIGCEVVRDVYAQVPEAGDHFHGSPSDVQGRGEVSAPSEVHDHLLGLLHVDKEVVLSAPTLQLFHLLPVVGLVVVSDPSHHSCVIRETSRIRQLGCIAEQSCVSRVNRRGLSTQPWGELVLRVMEEEETSWILTDCGLSVRKSRTQLHRVKLISPSVVSFWTRVCEEMASSVDLFLPICILVRVHSDVDAVLDVGHDQSLEALHDYRGEGYRPIVIQACHCGRFGDGDDHVAVFRQVGTAACWREVLKMSVSTSADENGTTLRSLYYPPVNSEKAKEGQLRCGEHSDYGSITLLFQNNEGLQVRRRSGEFICVPTIPGAILINIADLMQRWTADVFVSVLHRVLLPPAGDSSTRQSLAFFVHPDDEALITCCDGSNKYPPVTAGAYLIKRLSDTYGQG
ncbi:hypothetical protein L3Q82_023708 [Scortum barcoo]|uniref:Uncharacterized protein n=1 Tax=Scortum barcoo TaxID=214431 RepID=A0ACB8WTD8_9TELE|nr:hypothetical protein L3Q82_023708 [Scortum barcoo]